MFDLLNYFRSAPTPHVWHSHSTQQSRVLITAGVDGDEYDGICAAQALIQSYNLPIPITIIPIVNIPGYLSHTSYNPLDKRYP
ncbi:MAG: hypothetical protein DPW11_01280 [bacterium]|nr:hypothetical protein [Candidatus Microgenomates bacterium CPR3]MCQ3944395.1 hypothetical protein [bacterium]RIK51307.1 MAG: hypothetical protein DCC61_02995 [Candidatus Microgenomates bacterium]